MKNIIIYGAGSLGRLVYQIILDINKSTKEKLICLGYIDDNISLKGKEINGIKVLGDKKYLNNSEPVEIVVAFSNSLDREKAVNELRVFNHISYPNIIHPFANIPNTVKCGDGVIIFPGVIIDIDVEMKNFIIINKNSTVGHDSKIGSFCTISPGVNLGGNLKVGNCVEFGINSATIQQLEIGTNSVVGAGAVVINDIPDNVVVVGNPARIIKYKKL